MNWTDFDPVREQAIGLVLIYEPDTEKAAAFVDTYIAAFKAGMKVFYPWYTEQRANYNGLSSKVFPPFPHEVFPDLFVKNHHGPEIVEAADRFYEEFRVKERLNGLKS